MTARERESSGQSEKLKGSKSKLGSNKGERPMSSNYEGHHILSVKNKTTTIQRCITQGSGSQFNCMSFSLQNGLKFSVSKGVKYKLAKAV